MEYDQIHTLITPKVEFPFFEVRYLLSLWWETPMNKRRGCCH